MKKERYGMPIVAENHVHVSLNDHIATYMHNDDEFMDGIKKGVKDCKLGRVKPWKQVKEELGLK
jgi:hypothetical protein